MLNYDLNQSKRIEKQFSEILDYLLNDYENSLGRIYHKKEIMENVAGKLPTLTLQIIDREVTNQLMTDC
jgi:hypothetical protein